MEYESESFAEFAVRRLGRSRRLRRSIRHKGFCRDPLQLEVKSAFPFLADIERRNGKVLPKIKNLMRKLAAGNPVSFKWGMGTLTARLEEELRRNLMQGVSALGIFRDESNKPCVRIDVSARVISADAVVVTTPAPVAGELLVEIDPEIIAPIMAIPYVPIVAVYTAFRLKDLKKVPEGIGFVVPRSEGQRGLGTIFSSSLFAERCPSTEILTTSYFGGATDPSFIDLPDEEIRNQTAAYLDDTLGIDVEPVFFHIKRWEQVIPQYNIGHRLRVAEIEEKIAKQPGIFMAGSFSGGISCNDVITTSRMKVEEILKYLRRTV